MSRSQDERVMALPPGYVRAVRGLLASPWVRQQTPLTPVALDGEEGECTVNALFPTPR
jgi:hypothetical protein